jgi:hypothetical protein
MLLNPYAVQVVKHEEVLMQFDLIHIVALAR